MSNESPAAILFDEQGNPVGVLFDGYVYRLQTQNTIDDGYGHGPVAVKGPNQAATALDPALVVAPSPNSPFTFSPSRPSLNTTHSVASSATNTTLLTANLTRIGATVFNDSSAILYLKLGSTASLSDFTLKVFPGSYYEVPFGFTGQIDGFWASVNGFARIGELTP